MYCYNDMSQIALQKGYRVGILLFRATNDIPVTSYKISCSYAWEDLKQMVDFVNEKYVIDSITKQKKCQLYAYGVSLGANQLGLYLSHVGSQTPVDGATLFSAPYDVWKGYKHFYEVAWLTSWIIGQFLSSTLL